MSQVQLAAALNLTFQQVQKYERGINRVSASKLYEAGRTLGVPVAYFFDGLEGNTAEDALDETREAVRAFFATREGVEFARLFPQITTDRLRRQLTELARTLVESDM